MRAHWRPSLIAQTISDWPRRASPAAKTPGDATSRRSAALTLPRGSFSTPSWSTTPSCSGCRKPIASSTRSASSSPLGARRPARTAAPARPARSAACCTRPSSPVKRGRDDREVLLAAADRLGLLHRVGEAELLRPQRPRRAVVGARGAAARAAARAATTDARALADRVADAVGAGVAAADDDDVLARRGDRACRRRTRRRDPAVAHVEVVHREVHAVELAARRPAGRAARASRSPARPRRTRSRSSSARHVDADVDAAAQLDALGDELLDAALDDALLDLEVRARRSARARRPPRRARRARRGGRRGAAAARRPCPPGPAPTTATLRPGLARAAAAGTTQPSSHARSMIEFSICLIVTASPSRISSTHAASHGAGHRRPVNSGKLFVACSWRIASCQRSR